MSRPPRNESRYPLASFCSLVAADSIVRYRLHRVSQLGEPENIGSSCHIPLFDLIVTIIRLLDVS